MEKKYYDSIVFTLKNTFPDKDFKRPSLYTLATPLSKLGFNESSLKRLNKGL